MSTRAIFPMPADFEAFDRARFALLGFQPDQSRSIIAGLADMGITSRSFSSDAIPDVTEIDLYSGIVLNLTSEANESGWIADPRWLSLKPPLLAVGTCSDFFAFSAIQLSASEILFRPFTNVELAIRLRRCISGTIRRGVRDVTARKPCVVIADDDSSIIGLVSAVLRARGFDCYAARNGRQALELARTLSPDLLILDVKMPFINGFDVLSALRSDPSTAGMRILMLTAADSLEDRTRGTELGATAYLCKPFQPFQFVLRVKELLAA